MAESTTLAEALDSWMKRQRLEPAALARLADVSRPTVYAVLRGDRVRNDSLRKLARGLATDPHSGAIDAGIREEILRDFADASGDPDLSPCEVEAPDLRDLVRRRIKDPALADRLLAAIDKAETDPPSHRRSLRAVLDLYLQDRD